MFVFFCMSMDFVTTSAPESEHFNALSFAHNLSNRLLRELDQRRIRQADQNQRADRAGLGTRKEKAWNTGSLAKTAFTINSRHHGKST